MGFLILIGIINGVIGMLVLDVENFDVLIVEVIILMLGLYLVVVELDEYLFGKDFFNIDKGVVVVIFKLIVVDVDDDKDEVKVIGDLMMNGVIKIVVLDVDLKQIVNYLMSGKEVVGFDVEIEIKCIEFNLGQFVLVVSDEVEIIISIEVMKVE